MANQNVTKALGIGVIGVGVWMLYGALSNVIEFSGDNETLVLINIFWALAGVGLILYVIRWFREIKQKDQTNPPI